MKFLGLVIILCLATSDMRADAASKMTLIKEVLSVSGLRQTLENARVENVALTRKAVAQQPNAHADHPMMKRLIERVMEKYEAYSRELFSYEAHEGQYIAFYEEAFTEPELADVLAFYKTKAGQALLRSQPLLISRMQQSAFEKSTINQARIQRMMNETIAEIKEEFNEDGTPKPKKG